MKKINYIMLVVLAVITFLAGCEKQTNDNELNKANPKQESTQITISNPDEDFSKAVEQKTSEITNVSPSLLLSDEYNPFSNVLFPDSYSIYAAECEDLSEYFLYYLYLTTTDSAEDVVTFMSELLGDIQANSIEQNLAILKKDELLSIPGTQVETGLSADCEIKPTKKEEYLNYIEGYEVRLVMVVESEDIYDNLIFSNMNSKALSTISNYFDISVFEKSGIKVNAFQERVETYFGYHLDDAEKLWNDMTRDLANYYREEDAVINLEYGDIHLFIREDLTKGFIYIHQSSPILDSSIREYTANNSLKNFGFEDYRENGGKCTYKENNTWLSISKPEWGENPYGSEVNAVTFSQYIDKNSLLVFFYPKENKYKIIIEYDGKQAEYEYCNDTDSYSDDMGGNDLTEAKKIAELFFNKPDTDSILQDGWVTFDQYIDKTFGMNASELFELYYE